MKQEEITQKKLDLNITYGAIALKFFKITIKTNPRV